MTEILIDQILATRGFKGQVHMICEIHVPAFAFKYTYSLISLLIKKRREFILLKCVIVMTESDSIVRLDVKLEREC